MARSEAMQEIILIVAACERVTNQKKYKQRTTISTLRVDSVRRLFTKDIGHVLKSRVFKDSANTLLTEYRLSTKMPIWEASPYFHGLFYLELLIVAVPIVPFFLLFALFATLPRLYPNNTRLQNLARQLLIARNGCFFVVVALGAILLASLMGTLFVTTDNPYITIVAPVCGVVAEMLYFTLIYLLYTFVLNKPPPVVRTVNTNTDFKSYFMTDPSPYSESEHEELIPDGTLDSFGVTADSGRPTLLAKYGYAVLSMPD